MPTGYLICKIEEGEPVVFLAGCAFNRVQTLPSPLGARQFNSVELAASYAQFWKSREPWAQISIVEMSEIHRVHNMNEEIVAYE